MALYEQTPSRGGSRFGQLSTNMFFTRNTAKPKRVRHIEGLNGALICSVNDDPSVIRSPPASSLGFSRPNLPPLETGHRVERLVPPTGFWQTYGVIQDTDRWRQELATLANASGLGVEKDEQRQYHKASATADQHASRSGARYSTRTGRFNEGTSKSRGRTGSKHATPYSGMVFNVPENEREMWMLQVLCQLLGTSNLADVQSWLVSATPTEKEQARTMINSALQGLKESERTSNVPYQSADLSSLTTFVEKQRNEEKLTSQKFLQDSLNRPLPGSQSFNDNQQIDSSLKDSWTSVLNNPSGNTLSQDTTTFQRPYQNYNRRSFSSFDISTNNNASNENEANQSETENEEQFQENLPRSHSLSRLKKPITPFDRPFFSRQGQQQHPIDSLQLNDDEEDNEDQPREPILPPIKNKESFHEDEDGKARKIRQLQNKLSRQEEEAKRQINNLQSKQSRLENALKLLVKQTSVYGKRRQEDNEKDRDVPVVNVLIESQKENDRRHDSNKEKPISQSGVWKPDASTLHRLQGN